MTQVSPLRWGKPAPTDVRNPKNALGSIIMADLKVRVFKGNNAQPATTVTIPSGVLKIARNLVPQRAMAALRAQGIDLDEIVRLESNGFIVKRPE
jgi:hypothetical protein